MREKGRTPEEKEYWRGWLDAERTISNRMQFAQLGVSLAQAGKGDAIQIA